MHVKIWSPNTCVLCPESPSDARVAVVYVFCNLRPLPHANRPFAGHLCSEPCLTSTGSVGAMSTSCPIYRPSVRGPHCSCSPPAIPDRRSVAKTYHTLIMPSSHRVFIACSSDVAVLPSPSTSSHLPTSHADQNPIPTANTNCELRAPSQTKQPRSRKKTPSSWTAAMPPSAHVEHTSRASTTGALRRSGSRQSSQSSSASTRA
ncbi:hypothetical protein BD309DRAFT_718937 [Dichomitus squalens]|uniref:Uncharacterized protein n=1 Tax=Dichomitus squalens TaxID=114155 RepID=A0A4V2K6Y6_9APHY|nr:hypothetical protein BD309DRAFT_718937 [Dichomitus squalens]TBU54058.1 hypothetical protein BD310DRAFT_936783 [Dichomitus squalens]